MESRDQEVLQAHLVFQDKKDIVAFLGQWDLMESRDLQAPKVTWVDPVSPENPVVPVKRVHKETKVSLVRLVSLAKMVLQASLDHKEQLDYLALKASKVFQGNQ